MRWISQVKFMLALHTPECGPAKTKCLCPLHDTRSTTCSVSESARSCRMAPFLQAGFMCCAVVFSTPYCPSFGHHYRQLLSEGKVVSDEAMADMKGEEGAQGEAG